MLFGKPGIVSVGPQGWESREPAASAMTSRLEAETQRPGINRAFVLSDAGLQTEKEEPHPHVVCALGLRITNCEPESPSV